jgi:sugar phosphate isomerase/epimerase
MKPLIAIVNLFDQDAGRLLDFAASHGFGGIDWTIDQHQSRQEFLSAMERLESLEVRFHCPFHGVDIGYTDARRAASSLEVLTETMERIALAGRSYMTVHTGFGRVAEEELDFKQAVQNLATLVGRGAELGVIVCLENLASQWTSLPELFYELVQQSGAWVTLDLGHAHVCASRDVQGRVFERYLLPNRHKIRNAHIYHTEAKGEGHVAPAGIEDIVDRIELLKEVPSCDWWVIELKQINDILHTRELLNRCLEGPFQRMPLPL